ncbi:TlpA family protein disulfide reductase [Limimaricola hongkongensis]|uniref:Thiol:disulfide oxidoreductase TlpA n=1 Tax=Limimaricola hongkongensis DSM 17492 TaxID=1122180 RepID=A0A017HC12_9RHOB|nr:TlpA disulfide reductase family protein [Limimaricola hongkongensis]EYD72022.1 Thiol:disulfide oxidoreductase TlpA [Limimaricola hongkongensis DSM 17492]
MRSVVLIGLYMAATGLANAAPAELEALREGDMRKLAIHAEPQRGSDVAFESEAGGEITLAQYEGKPVLVNFWATWCAPCRVEMPQLAALQGEYGGEDFEVVTIATGRNDPAGMERFLAEIGAESLPRHKDPRQALARDLGVLGLPVTLILDAEGQEIGRLQGEADWSSDSARAIVEALIADARDG